MNHVGQSKNSPVARTDAEIARAVENVLNWTNSVPVSSIKFRVDDGVLTLMGALDFPGQGQTVFSQFCHMPGVRGVINRIEIRPSVSSALVKAEIEATLKRRIIRGIESIQVNVNDGVVTLSGTVGTWAERDVATHACWSAAGVRRVSDKLRLDW